MRLSQAPNVVQFPAQMTDAASMVQTDKVKLINLGSQISVCVQSYNDLKHQLMTEPNAQTHQQFSDLLAQRKAAIEALIDAHRAAAAQLQNKATTAGVPVDIQSNIPTLQGFRLGQLVDTTNLQNSIALEQTKLKALQDYYAAYQAAVAAGLPPPPVPAGLQSGGFMGLSPTMIMIGIAVIAGLFLMKR
jgi:hypothetical protein